MKRLFILLLLCFSASVYAQENPNKRCDIGITFSFFGDAVIANTYDAMGAASKQIDQFYAFGVVFLCPLNKWLEFEGGVEYKHFKVIIKPVFTGVQMPSYSENMSIVDIPLLLRATFLKYCFVNGGLLINTGSSGPINSQSGIGSKLGIGLKYQFKQKITVFVNPYATLNAMLPFSSDDNFQRIWESGIRFGVTYKL